MFRWCGAGGHGGICTEHSIEQDLVDLLWMLFQLAEFSDDGAEMSQFVQDYDVTDRNTGSLKRDFSIWSQLPSPVQYFRLYNKCGIFVLVRFLVKLSLCSPSKWTLWLWRIISMRLHPKDRKRGHWGGEKAESEWNHGNNWGGATLVLTLAWSAGLIAWSLGVCRTYVRHLGFAACKTTHAEVYDHRDTFSGRKEL